MHESERAYIDQRFEEVHEHLTIGFKKLERFIAMTSQADIDQITSALSDVDASVNSAETGLASEIEGLKAANPNLDLTRLTAIKDKLATDVQTVSSLSGGLTPTDGSTATSGDTVTGSLGTSQTASDGGVSTTTDPAAGDNEAVDPTAGASTDGDTGPASTNTETSQSSDS